MSSEDTEYYRKRAEAELELAETVSDAAVAAVHSELALEYARLARSLDMGEESRWQGFRTNGCR